MVVGGNAPLRSGKAKDKAVNHQQMGHSDAPRERHAVMSDNTNENPGLWSSIWRFFTFWKVRKALGWVRAADRQFTGSTGGIRDAFDLAQNKAVKEYQDTRDAVAEVEGVLEDNRQELDRLNKKEEELIGLREGALVKFEEAQKAGDAAAQAKHQEAFNRFDKEIHDIEVRQAELEARIKESGSAMDGYLRQLTKLQDEIRRLPEEKARAIADFVSSKKIIELNDRLQGIRGSLDRGPIEAVLEENRKLTAKARISQKLAGTDVEAQNDEYKAAGIRSSSGDRMAQMLAARKAERDAKTGAGVAAPKVAATSERPQI